MAWSGFTAKPKKSGFFLDSITPLGFEESKGGLRPSGEKVKDIVEYPVPQSLDEVCAFLAITTYLRHFIPGRADLAVILKQAAVLEDKTEWMKRHSGVRTKGGRLLRPPRAVVKWEWGEEQQAAFEKMKMAILKNAIYGGDEKRQYHLATDASKVGIGGVLFQLVDC